MTVFSEPTAGIAGAGPTTALRAFWDTWLAHGEALGPGAATVILAAAFLLRRSVLVARGQRLWLLPWALSLVLCIWWPAALFTTRSDPVVMLAWFVYYGPTLAALVAAVPLVEPPPPGGVG